MSDKENWRKFLQYPNFSLAIRIFVGITTLLVLGLYIHAFYFLPINTDAGFYLAIAENLSDGAVLYKDIWMRYTPLGIYIFNITSIWTSNPTYTDYLSIIYLFNILNAGWVYLISKRLGLNQLVSFGASIITLGLCYKYEATFIVLEPFVVFFLLASSFLSLHATRSDRLWIFTGFCVAAAFLCKQYGLAIMPALGYWMYKMGGWKYMWKLIGLFSIGFAIPMVSLLTYYVVYADIMPSELLSIWLSSGGYGNFSLMNILWSLALFMMLSTPILLCYPFTLSKDKPTLGLKLKDEKYFLLALLTSMLLPLVFQQYEHYFIFIIPYAVLLGAYLLNDRGKYQKWIYLALALNLIIFSTRIVRATYRACQAPTEMRSQQFEQAVHLNKFIPPNSKVLLLSHYHQRLNYLCQFQPVLPSKLGYTFPENLTDKELRACLQETNIVVTEKYDLNTFPRYDLLLTEHHFRKLRNLGDLEVWIK